MSNPNRCGKIARLPKPIREEINQRLERGATAKSLVPWLNGLPEVQALVAAEFDGHPVSVHNLSQWKNGGYQDWLRFQEALALAEHLYEKGEEWKAMGKERMPITEVLTLWQTARLAMSTREIESMEGEAAWKRQRQMCDDLMKLRRAEHREAHLQLERERLELQRAEVQLERERFEAEKQFKARAEKRQEKSRRRQSASGHDGYFDSEESDRPMTDDEKEARWKAALGIPYAPPLKVVPASPLA